MSEVLGAVIGIHARVIGSEHFHFVEAMLNRVELGLITQMPLAREVSAIAVLLEELGDRRRGLRQAVLVARHYHDRKGRADRDASGHERGDAGPVVHMRQVPILQARSRSAARSW